MQPQLNPGPSNVNVPNVIQPESTRPPFIFTQKPPNTYLPPDASENTDSAPESPDNTYLPPESPDNTYLPPESPDNTYLPPESPDNTYLPPEKPDLTYLPPDNSNIPPQNPDNSYIPPELPEETGPDYVDPLPEDPNETVPNAYLPPPSPNNTYIPPDEETPPKPEEIFEIGLLPPHCPTTDCCKDSLGKIVIPMRLKGQKTDNCCNYAKLILPLKFFEGLDFKKFKQSLPKEIDTNQIVKRVLENLL